MKRILFLISAFLAIVIILFIFAVPSPSPSPVEDGTDDQATPGPSQNLSSLSIVSVAPPQNLDEEKLPIQQITVRFSQTINPTDIFYSVSPAQEISIRQGNLENEIIISSKESWEEGINTIRFLIETVSVSGAHLDEDFEYSFMVGFPRTLPPDLEE